MNGKKIKKWSRTGPYSKFAKTGVIEPKKAAAKRKREEEEEEEDSKPAKKGKLGRPNPKMISKSRLMTSKTKMVVKGGKAVGRNKAVKPAAKSKKVANASTKPKKPTVKFTSRVLQKPTKVKVAKRTAYSVGKSTAGKTATTPKHTSGAFSTQKGMEAARVRAQHAREARLAKLQAKSPNKKFKGAVAKVKSEVQKPSASITPLKAEMAGGGAPSPSPRTSGRARTIRVLDD
jgi:hypothetical protein